jgi:hypothetical protein
MSTYALPLIFMALLTACSKNNSAQLSAGAGGGGPIVVPDGDSKAGAGAGGSAGSSASAAVSVAGQSGTTPDDVSDPNASLSCATAEYEATLRPLDMLVLLDQSGSMTEHDDRWTPTTSAIKRFVGARESDGMGIGLQYFPLGKNDGEKCEVQTYATPAVPLGILPGNAHAMTDSIDAHYFTKENCCDAPEHQGTPTRPAIEGVFEYLRSWLKAHPERNAVVLLATDGHPSECSKNDIDDVSASVAQAANGTPSIKTYVIGIGDQENLDDLAKAGGTGQGAFLVDGSGTQTEVQLLDTLAKIRGVALQCDFDVPSGIDSDPGKTNVERASGAKAVTTLVKVPQESDCAKASAGGWYYDGATNRIQLCPDTCREVLADTTAKVSIVVGCATVLL